MRHICIFVALPFLLLSGAQSAFGQSDDVRQVDRQYYIKAAFLYHFTNFIDWPPDALPADSSVTIIGILGRDPFGEALKTIEGKTVAGRRLVVERFPTLEELRPCQVLFISPSERGRLKEIVETIAGDHVLTVGEMDGFAQRWGIVNFQVTGNKVRFEINRARAQRAGLRISSRLLRVATIVNDDVVRSTAGGN